MCLHSHEVYHLIIRFCFQCCAIAWSEFDHSAGVLGLENKLLSYEMALPIARHLAGLGVDVIVDTTQMEYRAMPTWGKP